jgi:hypothetical protein
LCVCVCVRVCVCVCVCVIIGYLYMSFLLHTSSIPTYLGSC